MFDVMMNQLVPVTNLSLIENRFTSGFVVIQPAVQVTLFIFFYIVTSSRVY